MLMTHTSDLASAVPVLTAEPGAGLPGEQATYNTIKQLGDLAADTALATVLNQAPRTPLRHEPSRPRYYCSLVVGRPATHPTQQTQESRSRPHDPSKGRQYTYPR